MLEVESCVSDIYDTSAAGVNEESNQNNEIELQNQRQLIEKLQRLSNLKRKSDEFLQKNYFSEIINPEKRPKIKEKLTCKQNSQIFQTNNFENVKNLYDENPVNITTSLNTQLLKVNTEELCDKSKNQTLSESEVELKTECDDSDIIVTDPAVCSSLKNYESSRDGNKDLSVTMDYPSPQDSKYFLKFKESFIQKLRDYLHKTICAGARNKKCSI